MRRRAGKLLGWPVAAPVDGRITILAGDERGQAEAEHFGITFIVQPLTQDNCRTLRDRHHPFPEDGDASDPWQFKNFRVT